MKCSFFQPPQFLSLPIFGLSISQASIKVVKLKKDKQGLIPVVAQDTPLQEPCNFFTDTNTYSECEEIKKSLKSLKKMYGIKFAQLSIPEENTYVFKITVPHDAISMIDEFILNNIDQHIPLTASEVFFDYKILKSHIQDAQVPVVVTAIPKIVVEKYASLLESCGIMVIGCEPETHAIAHSVIDKDDKNPYVIVNIDEQATKISVVEEGLVQYTQTLPIKTQDFQAGVSNEAGATLKDAINRVIIFWFTSKEQNTQNSKIENIIITGTNIESSGLINFFESNLSVNASYGNVWKNCFDINSYIPRISKGDSLKYAACIGLSMFKIK
jgi:Tfp pilus assembly PilM family ATPase